MKEPVFTHVNKLDLLLPLFNFIVAVAGFPDTD